MENIQGEIEGKQVISKGISFVEELEATHYIVTSGAETFEVFLSSSGLLGEGNALDGIEVKIISERERIIHDRYANTITNVSAGNAIKGMILKAPMPGMVKAISVTIGDSVQKNTQVLVLEAMKMENAIMAGVTGIVSKIHAEAGTSVEKNMLLVEFRTRE